jgi:hypothetical protein
MQSRTSSLATLGNLAFALALLGQITEARAQDLELALRTGAVSPLAPDDGFPGLGIAGGATGLIRLGDHFGIGALIDTAWFRWHAPPPRDGVHVPGYGYPDDEGSIQSTLYAAAFRWVPLEATTLLPYAELSFGWVSVLQDPDDPTCGDGSGPSGQLALGLDWTVASWARLGAMAGGRPYLAARGCDGITIVGGPPEPPSARLLLSGQLAFTTVWGPR